MIKRCCWIIIGLLFGLTSCNKDEEGVPPLSGESKTFSFWSDGNMRGTVVFAKRSDNSTQITIEVTGTEPGAILPAFFNLGTAAEPKGILLILTAVDGGESVTNIAALIDGTPITYDQLIAYDGNITLHKSFKELGTIVLFSDIGINELTGTNTEFDIFDSEGTSIGLLNIEERASGKSLALLTLDNGGDGSIHPGFIHENSVIEDGNVLISLSVVDAVTGTSRTNIEKYDNGTAVSYLELIDISGNVRVLESDGSTLKASGDIGQIVLTGEEITYELASTSGENINGTATLSERKNGTTLITIEMNGTSSGVNHSTHIHQSNAIDGGSIVISFNKISGSDGISQTNISEMDDGTSITYSQLLDFDGHVVVHPGPGQFDILARGDIGQNELTGSFEEYALTSQSVDDISGTVFFWQRKNNNTVVEMLLEGTTPGSNHATHIHQNTMIKGGSIDISFNEIAGTTGLSKTNITKKDDGSSITYDEITNYDGHIVVHPNSNQFDIVARGDIGRNVLSGVSKEYTLNAVSGSGVSGIVTFFKRKSGFAMIKVEVTGTIGGNMHANHIHENNAATGGSIVLDFNKVDGATGISMSDAIKFNEGTSVTYEELINYDGHVIVHHHVDFSKISRGDIGSNAN